MGSLVKAVISPITSIVSGIFGSDEPTATAAVPPPPPVEKPTPMPTPDDAVVQAAKRKAAAAQAQRSGRISTILTDSNDKLGA